MAKAQTATEPETKTEMSDKASATPCPKFTLDRLRKDCLSLFGVTVCTFDGATYGFIGKYSVEEIRDRIKGWQNTRVLPARKKEVN